MVIDTDAGGDDSQAIVLAISEARRTGKTILGITCIDGNANLDDVATNVLISVSLCNADIPVYKGKHIFTHRFQNQFDGTQLQRLLFQQRWTRVATIKICEKVVSRRKMERTFNTLRRS